MFEEPQQCLPSAAELRHLVENESDGFLNPPIRILFDSVADLNEANGRGNDKLAALGLLIARRQGALPEKVELIFIETALQAEQKSVVTLTRRIDCLLVDQHRIDDTAHFDKLLPVAAVSGKARYLSRGDRSNLAEANLGDHPIEACASDPASRRTSEIIINDFDARPAQRRQAVTHRILQGPAFAIVQNLMS